MSNTPKRKPLEPHQAREIRRMLGRPGDDTWPIPEDLLDYIDQVQELSLTRAGKINDVHLIAMLVTNWLRFSQEGRAFVKRDAKREDIDPLLNVNEGDTISLNTEKGAIAATVRKIHLDGQKMGTLDVWVEGMPDDKTKPAKGRDVVAVLRTAGA